MSQGPAHLQSAALATELCTLLLSTNLMLLSIVALRLWIYIRVEGLRRLPLLKGVMGSAWGMLI